MAISVYEQVKKALQDIVAPELKALQIEIKRLDEKIESVKNEMLSEIRRLDGRIDGLDMKIDSLDKGLNGRIDGLDVKINSLDKGLNERIDGLARELKVAIEIRERLSALEAKVGIKIGTE